MAKTTNIRSLLNHLGQSATRRATATSVAYEQRCVHDLIEQRSREWPSNIAVQCGTTALTYAELLERSARIAAGLRSAGVQPGDCVALGMDPSVDRVASVLAVMRAGATWLPLDLDLPAPRVRFMCDDAAVRGIVTSHSLGLPNEWLVQDLAGASPVAAVDVASPMPAYVIYTSGSTGQPKGAMIQHASLVNRLLWMANAFEMGPEDRVLHKTNFAFDVSVWEYLLPLLTGACVVVLPRRAAKDPNRIADAIKEHRVTLCHFVPAMLGAFLEYDVGERCVSLRAVVSSGEALSEKLAHKLHRHLKCALFNLYGPTEATIDVSFHRFSAQDSGEVPIGRPVANTTLHVLDEALRPVPPGVVGELYIGGAQVGVGYVGRSRLTAASFLPDPYTDEPGRRMYRTGDRVEQRPDGALLFRGRTDGQLKIRGYRVELQEIERTLEAQPEVEQAVVLAQRKPGGVDLRAYILVAAGHNPTQEALRGTLAQCLPAYMVPSTIHVLQSMPLTPSGKADRQRLEAEASLHEGRPDEREAHEQQTARRELSARGRLTRIWQELLGRTSIGRDEDFFRIGGDSILAIRMVAWAHREGLEVTVAEVFSHPTLAELEKVVRVRHARSAESTVALPGPLALWIRHEALARWHSLSFTSPGITVESLRTVLLRLVGRHEALRLHIDRDALSLQPDPERAVSVIAKDRQGEDEPLGSSVRAVVDGSSVKLLVSGLSADAARARELVEEVLSELVNPSDYPGLERNDYLRWAAELGQNLPVWQEPSGTDRDDEDSEMVQTSLECSQDDFRSLANDSHTTGAELSLALVEKALQQLGIVYDRLLVIVDARPSRAQEQFSKTLGRFTLPVLVPGTSASNSIIGVVREAKRKLRAALTTSGENARASVAIEYTSGQRPEYGPLVEGVPLSISIAGTKHLSLSVRAHGSHPARHQLGDLARAIAAALIELREQSSQASDCPYIVDDFPAAKLSDHELSSTPELRAGVEDVFTLTPLQHGMLFRSIYWPQSDAYFNQNVLELVGDLQPELLLEAWAAVARRYEILRMGFLWSGLNEAHQYVLTDPTIPWRRHDWRDLEPHECDAKLTALLEEDRGEPLRMSEAPLYRLQLIRVGERRHFLLWSHHHILLDGWCLSLIWGDVFKAYDDLVLGKFVPFPPVRPYRHFVAWLAQQDSNGPAKTYWQETLEGYDEVTRFAGTNGIDDAPFETIPVVLSERLSTAVRDLGSALGVTTNVIVQTMWSLMLARYGGKSDVVHGVSVSGRPPQLEGVEHMVGLFINTVPLRVKIDWNAPLSTLLRNVQRSLTLASEYAHVSLAQIKAWCGASGQFGAAIFDSLVAFENYPEDNLPQRPMGGVQIIDRMAAEKTEYPLGLIVLPGKDLIFHFNFSTAHFDHAAVHELAGLAQSILERMTQDANALVARVADLPQASQYAVIDRYNMTVVPRPERPSLAELVLRRAVEAPEDVAVRSGDIRLTYRQLMTIVAELTDDLRQLGLHPGDRVVLTLPATEAFVAALLAALYAGLEFAVLELDEPEARARSMLKQFHPRAALTTRTAPAWLDGIECIIAERQPSEIPRLPAVAHLPPDAAACVYFTSGSTGAPKGVTCTRRGLHNRLLWSLEAFASNGERRRVLQNARLSFDICLWEVLFPLISGGRVVMGGRSRMDPDTLAQLISEDAVDVLHLVPSMLEVFVDAEAASQCATLRHVITGGEALSRVQAKRFFDLGLACQLHHAYGPTEAAISVTHWTCKATDVGPKAPLGFPIDNTRLYVLDERLRSVPIGSIGDIFISGEAVAEGYLGDARSTASKFVPDPFGRVPGQRMYRTGDLGRRLRSGALEFSGRADDQIKLRGNRVEIGEVQVAVAAAPGVTGAEVLALRGPSGDQQLVAFVTPESAAGDVQAMSEAIAHRLPPWMHPAAYVGVREFPITPNGKLDRASLAELGARASKVCDYVAPEGEVEELVARAFATVLGLDKVSAEASFFDLGGHSLLMMHLVTQLRRALPAHLSCDITQVFKAPTVRALSQRIKRETAGWGGTPIVALSESASRAAPLYLIHPAEGIGSAYRYFARSLQTHSVYAVNNPRFGDMETPFQSVREMASVYRGHILKHLGGRRECLLGGWSFGGVVSLELAAQLRAEGVTVETVVLFDSYNLSVMPRESVDKSDLEHRLSRRGVEPHSREGRLFMHEILNNGHLGASHTPSPYSGRVILYRATADGRPLSSVGWDPAAYPALEQRVAEGTHQTLFDPPSALRLAQDVRNALAS